MASPDPRHHLSTWADKSPNMQGKTFQGFCWTTFQAPHPTTPHGILGLRSWLPLTEPLRLDGPSAGPSGQTPTQPIIPSRSSCTQISTQQGNSQPYCVRYRVRERLVVRTGDVTEAVVLVNQSSHRGHRGQKYRWRARADISTDANAVVKSTAAFLQYSTEWCSVDRTMSNPRKASKSGYLLRIPTHLARHNQPSSNESYKAVYWEAKGRDLAAIRRLLRYPCNCPSTPRISFFSFLDRQNHTICHCQ